MSFDLLLNNGTISISSSGELEIVTGQNKLSQDIIKIIATASGTNLAHKWYGSSIPEKIVGSGLRLDLLKTEIVKNIQSCLQNLKSLQEQQVRAGQVLVPEEAIATVEGIQIIGSSDPRDLIIVITIKTRANNILQEELTLRI